MRFVFVFVFALSLGLYLRVDGTDRFGEEAGNAQQVVTYQQMSLYQHLDRLQKLEKQRNAEERLPQKKQDISLQLHDVAYTPEFMRAAMIGQSSAISVHKISALGAAEDASPNVVLAGFAQPLRSEQPLYGGKTGGKKPSSDLNTGSIKLASHTPQLAAKTGKTEATSFDRTSMRLPVELARSVLPAFVSKKRGQSWRIASLGLPQGGLSYGGSWRLFSSNSRLAMLNRSVKGQVLALQEPDIKMLKTGRMQKIRKARLKAYRKSLKAKYARKRMIRRVRSPMVPRRTKVRYAKKYAALRKEKSRRKGVVSSRKTRSLVTRRRGQSQRRELRHSHVKLAGHLKNEKLRRRLQAKKKRMAALARRQILRKQQRKRVRLARKMRRAQARARSRQRRVRKIRVAKKARPRKRAYRPRFGFSMDGALLGVD